MAPMAVIVQYSGWEQVGYRSRKRWLGHGQLHPGNPKRSPTGMVPRIGPPAPCDRTNPNA